MWDWEQSPQQPTEPPSLPLPSAAHGDVLEWLKGRCFLILHRSLLLMERR